MILPTLCLTCLLSLKKLSFLALTIFSMCRSPTFIIWYLNDLYLRLATAVKFIAWGCERRLFHKDKYTHK